MRSVVGAWDPEVIDEAIPQLEELGGAAGSHAPARISDDPPVSLSSSDMEAWKGEQFTAKPEGGIDRSETLFWIGCGVARGLRNKDLSDAAKLAIIEDAVAGRDEALGYRKYAQRIDSAVQYASLARKALQEVSDQPTVTITQNGRPRDPRGEEKSPFASRGVGVTKVLADAILEDDHFAQDAGSKLYRYSGGTYKQHAERYIRRRVKEILEDLEASEKWSSHRANEVVEYIRADAPELWERPPLNEVNVLNGILDVENKRLREHDPGSCRRCRFR